MNRLDMFYLKAFMLITVYVVEERNLDDLEKNEWLIEIAEAIDVEVKELISDLLYQYQNILKGEY